MIWKWIQQTSKRADSFAVCENWRVNIFAYQSKVTDASFSSWMFIELSVVGRWCLCDTVALVSSRDPPTAPLSVNGKVLYELLHLSLARSAVSTRDGDGLKNLVQLQVTQRRKQLHAAACGQTTAWPPLAQVDFLTATPDAPLSSPSLPLPPDIPSPSDSRCPVVPLPSRCLPLSPPPTERIETTDLTTKGTWSSVDTAARALFLSWGQDYSQCCNNTDEITMKRVNTVVTSSCI